MCDKYMLVRMKTGEVLVETSSPEAMTVTINRWVSVHYPLNDLTVTTGDGEYVPAEVHINQYPI